MKTSAKAIAAVTDGIKAGIYLLNRRVFAFWEEDGFMHMRSNRAYSKFPADGVIPSAVGRALEIKIIDKQDAIQLVAHRQINPELPQAVQNDLLPMLRYVAP